MHGLEHRSLTGMDIPARCHAQTTLDPGSKVADNVAKHVVGDNDIELSRIAHHLEVPDYSLDELVAIGGLMLREQRFRLSAAAEAVFRDYLARRMTQPRFANARSVRNALERARLRHAGRLIAAGGRVGRPELTTLAPEDFLGSRVFGTA